ncbi:MAG: C4-dicarboxylate ABC transporter, partial [Eubacteriales bacterium]
IVAIVGVTFFTFYTTFRMMKVEISPKPETMNFSWIMAPIANMAVLLIGNPVLNQTIKFYPDKALTVLLLNLVLLGIGFFLFIFISAIIFVRLAQYSLPPAETTPSFGIFLSAVGLAVSAIIDSAKNALSMGLLVSTDLSFLSATVIWGFGFWIVGIVIIICIYQTAKGGIPFSLGWWAFIFPLAAYTLSSLKVSVIFNTPFSLGYTAFLSILLFVLWLYTIINTIKGIKSGILFAGFPINKR